jgi:hypothetical protein
VSDGGCAGSVGYCSSFVSQPRPLLWGFTVQAAGDEELGLGVVLPLPAVSESPEGGGDEGVGAVSPGAGVAVVSGAGADGSDDDGSVIEGGVDALAVSAGESASDVKACPSWSGSALPRRAARRRMPWAARADRKNLGGTES